MDDGSTDIAVERIMAAIARIERAVKTSRSPEADPHASSAFDALTARHERLKAAVSISIEQMDRLLADRADGGPG